MQQYAAMCSSLSLAKATEYYILILRQHNIVLSDHLSTTRRFNRILNEIEVVYAGYAAIYSNMQLFAAV